MVYCWKFRFHVRIFSVMALCKCVFRYLKCHVQTLDTHVTVENQFNYVIGLFRPGESYDTE